MKPDWMEAHVYEDLQEYKWRIEEIRRKLDRVPTEITGGMTQDEMSEMVTELSIIEGDAYRAWQLLNRHGTTPKPCLDPSSTQRQRLEAVGLDPAHFLLTDEEPFLTNPVDPDDRPFTVDPRD